MGISFSHELIRSRRELIAGLLQPARSDEAAEGGCGVLGFAASLPVAGRHVLAASRQMHNRGNGKGGGIAMTGLDPAQMRVDATTLHSHYLLQIALLDPAARAEVEAEYILPYFEVAQAYEIDRLDDYRQVKSGEGLALDVRPPDVWRYFVRVLPDVLERFAAEKSLTNLPARLLEDEFVYQNTYRLNRHFYASLGEKRAFVLSHGRNLSVLKIVGYAEDVVEYYRLHDQLAHVWISHQRYPTKGRVWHPGGAHPFIGLNEALVHNGDFANYHAVSEYLRQRNIGQLFLTDTEVSVQLFDLLDRVYQYPLEVTLEAMAPTTEHDYAMLPDDKKALYQAVQRTHMHGSPDGPWFFILARSLIDEGGSRYELLGITDTSMLRPQVFALYENKDLGKADDGSSDPAVQIGVIASERQAINACMRSLSAEDERFQPLADKYWVARGGSHTDGGAFRFTVTPLDTLTRYGSGVLTCENKFGRLVPYDGERQQVRLRSVDPNRVPVDFTRMWEGQVYRAIDDGGAPILWEWLERWLPSLSWDEVAWILDWLRSFGSQGDLEMDFALQSMTLLHDRRYNTGKKKRASLLGMVDAVVDELLGDVPSFNGRDGTHKELSAHRITWESRDALRSLEEDGAILVIDAMGFPAEGDESTARWMVRAAQMGWRRMIVYHWRGGRFAACGLGPDSDGVRVDLYGDVGDYAASGLDGAEIHLHGDGQDQVGQILKRGRLVVYGDVGQTFLYGAKGGEVFVLGSAAGRPLINAVGKPRVVINGTCLDYLAESFMAGDPHKGGGFAILNGVTYDDQGCLVDLESPYPGGNLFSLASGGAIYLRDPHHRLLDSQLNGGIFVRLSRADWKLIEPYLQENERLFSIRVGDLLTVDGKQREPQEVYRKVMVSSLGVLSDKETENQ